MDGQLTMNSKLTCVCSGRGFIFVGDDVGRVHFLNRRMEAQRVKVFEGSVDQVLQVTLKTEFG